MNLFNFGRMTTGFVAVLVGYTSAAAIIFQVAVNLAVTDSQLASWFWALGIGMAMTTIGLSWYYRAPILIVWSTPGAALLVSGVVGLSLGEAIGVFLVSSLLITLTGITGAFDRLIALIPSQIASAMLAGVLLQFGLQVVTEFSQHPLLVGAVVVSFFIVKPILPRYTILISLLVGLVVAISLGQADFDRVSWQVSSPVWVTPEFNITAIIGVAVPLYIVTMASQNLPGFAVLQAHNYKVPASPIITTTGLMGVLMAPFGGFAYNLAAITAAICMGEEADSDPKQRYWAAIWAGLFTVIAGVFATTVVGIFLALPPALVAAIAGLALMSTIGNSLGVALVDTKTRDAAIVTFLVTASGISIFGINSAFWGLLTGLCALAWWVPKKRV